MQKGRKGHGKGKGKKTEFWAVSEAAFREMTEAPPSAGASPEGASALGSGGEVTKSEPDDPPGTGGGKGSEMKLEPVADPENAKEDMAAPAGLVPFFAPPPLGDPTRAEYLQDMRDWLQGNLTLAELKWLMQ